MTITLAHIHRHPLKAHGWEALLSASLTPGACLPWDRHWAVTHGATKFDTAAPEWVPPVNFSRGAKAPQLMAIRAVLDEGTGQLTLRHPHRPDIAFNPEDSADQARFLDWVRPLCPTERAMPQGVVKVAGRGMTDSPFPSISVLNLASNQALGAQMGLDLSLHRWRANLWLSGLPAWSEFDLLGKRMRVGSVELEVVQRITRCKATTANPDTGEVDADTLNALQTQHGHQDFGIFVTVVTGGEIRCDDLVEVL